MAEPKKLTRKILKRAKHNAWATQDARVVVYSEEYDSYFDYPNTPEVRAKIGEENIRAVVHWDGTVDKIKRGKGA
jgi:hypothetical protein